MLRVSEIKDWDFDGDVLLVSKCMRIHSPKEHLTRKLYICYLIHIQLQIYKTLQN